MPDQRMHVIYSFNEWEIDIAQRELRSRTVAVPLGSRAFEIVEILVRSGGELVGKYDLMNHVWPGAIVEDNTLQFHISAIRKALGPDRELLKTVFGRGYRLLGTWTIREGSKPANPVDLGSERKLVPSFQTNVPAEASPLIGRTTARLHLLDILSAYRVVTLTGPGGIGKSVLGLEVARSIFPTFDGDCWFVELVSLADPGLVPTAVARVLGLTVGGDEISAEAVARAIGGTKLLLVLDNCEHVIDGAAELADTVVRTCRGTSVLATTREILRIAGEYVYRVPALDVPPQHPEAAENIHRYSAVQLFIARLTESDSDFSAHPESLPTIAAICRRLDGIPLAIEFAAARAATLGIHQVREHLNDRFKLLTAGRRTALPRHQTLRATLDWSYELLPESERCLLRRLAIFVAGFTLQAATAVMSDADAATVAEGVASLVAKSLVTLDGAVSSGRWRLLETIRAYAIEKLGESGEAQQAARRHAEFYRDLFASLAPSEKLESVEESDRYGREIDNIRAALEWAFSPVGDAAIGVVLTAAYAPLWIHSSLMVECRERTERAMERLDPQVSLSPVHRMKLYMALGLALIYTMGPVDRAKEVLSKALEAAEDLDDVDAQLRALWGMWALHITIGECYAAHRIAEQFSRVSIRSCDTTVALVGDRLLGNALQQQGKLEAAQRRFEHVLTMYIEPKGQRNAVWYNFDQLALARGMLARGLCLQGSVEQASAQAQVCLEEARAGEHLYTLCTILRYAVGSVALMTHDLVTAERAATMLIDLADSHNALYWRIVGLLLKGRVLIKRGKFDTGMRLLRNTLGTCDRTGWTIGYPEFLGAHAEGLAGLGQLTEAVQAVDHALARADLGGERWYVPELLRVKGEFLFQEAGSWAISAGEDCLKKALAVARKQGALFWELRTTLSLARLRVRQERYDDAQQALAPVYDRFTEGFETSDLRSARTMLEKLQSRR
jgi:predicted ATPase/DNA-binding winged helix-turn-helix (wHTH) protein